MDKEYLPVENFYGTQMQPFSEYSQRLFRFIRGKVDSDQDAEDILQDVWFQYLNTAATKTIRTISAWLFTVARNKITDNYRKKKPELLDDIFPVNEDSDTGFREILFSDEADPEMQVLKNLFWEELWVALDELPENQRTAFVENELEDRTLQEIADAAGENIKTIISRKRYAVIHLRKRLKFLYDDLMNY